MHNFCGEISVRNLRREKKKRDTEQRAVSFFSKTVGKNATGKRTSVTVSVTCER